MGDGEPAVIRGMMDENNLSCRFRVSRMVDVGLRHHEPSREDQRDEPGLSIDNLAARSS